MKQLVTISTIVLFIASCASTKISNEQGSITTKQNVREYSVQSVLWQQTAAEYRALCYQAYQTAKLKLDFYLETTKPANDMGFAIITDIDETVLDNSPYNAWLIENNQNYKFETWKAWTDKASATTVPGAKEFLNYAQSRGVEVFYVSNRIVAEKTTTMANLKNQGLPYADEAHLLLKSDKSSKLERFKTVTASHNVLLYIGDNLSDFPSAKAEHSFEVPSTQERNANTDRYNNYFGNYFIVLPNPMYGDWETKGIYQGKHNWTEQQADSLRKSNLRGF
ncbi:MAG: 5'-nucleotidase, lipoprotein e(P4) family [Bacteroidia bacterium]|jgi:5'-nucleotidase (lipoprotein e(P4) family)|nr:MAG: 5'-nucleotidase, lipoprotein e(P4) family [Bacteroidia bacterium]